MSLKILATTAVAVAALGVAGGAQTSTSSSAAIVGLPTDPVVEWNRTMVAALLATATPPQPGTRIGAIVQIAVFDAVNGITRQYSQYRPDAIGTTAPFGASPTAAAVGAAYTTLVALLPAQKATFDAQLAASLPRGRGVSTARGLAWGQTVANAILALRSTDGFTAILSPYVVGPLPAWQPALPSFAGPVFRQFATMTPWTMTSSSQFDPGPPPALTSARYTHDFNEVKALGSSTSLTRTPEQTSIAQFWNGHFDTVATIWNRVGNSFAARPGRSLTANARFFALLNVAMADSVIAVWNAKNTYNTWRPITAIANAGIYDATGASPDPLWRPMLPTPPHQEYPSGHSGVSAAALAVLASFFGSNTGFSASSDGVPGAASTVRSFSSFADANAEIALARIAAGFHFRFSCEIAASMGDEVAAYAMTTQMLPRHHSDQFGGGNAQN
jgi:membrane-associated phospholipid phosphatase